MGKKARIKKIMLNGYGSFLGMEAGCFVVKEKNGKNEKYPLLEEEIGEIILKTGNTVSVGALASCGFWEIDVLVTTRKDKSIATLRSLEYDSHVKTRICQYEALKNGKGIGIAKQIVKAKIETQNIILKKYGLKQHDLMSIKTMIDKIEGNSLNGIKRKLLGLEGKCTNHYFKQIFQLFPKNVRVENRRTFKAYHGINNIFNLAYTMLNWKVYRAVIKAKLEAYLGFLHSIQFGKPSLVCDLTELYRYLIDDFLIQYCQKLKTKDFILKTEFTKKRSGKREYLNDTITKDFMEKLNEHFLMMVKIPRIRTGEKQELETLINEETELLAKYLRARYYRVD